MPPKANEQSIIVGHVLAFVSYNSMSLSPET